jgi:hypothetical protein
MAFTVFLGLCDMCTIESFVLSVVEGAVRGHIERSGFFFGN